MRGKLERIIVAVFVATLLFARQIASLQADLNRFYWHWRPSDALAIILAILLLAAAFYGGRIIAVSMGNFSSKVYNHLFLLALASGLLANIPFLLPESNWLYLLWIIVAALVGYSFGRPDRRFVVYGKNFCLVFSPLILILFGQLVLFDSWGTDPESKAAFLDSVVKPRPSTMPQLPDAGSAAGSSPVFFFVFDAWSRERSTDENGNFLPMLSNIGSLASQAFVFRNAQSAGGHTVESLPAMVYQTDNVTFQDPQPPTASVFQSAHDAGYKTALIGFYFPYRKILGQHLDYSFSRTHFPKGRHVAEKISLAAVRNLLHFTDPVLHPAYKRIYPVLYSNNWFRINNEVLDEATWLLRECPNNTFALFHWPLPHSPFVFNADGTFFGYDDGHRGGQTLQKGPAGPQGYIRHLQYMDVIVGRLMEVLRAAGKYESATLILTADHGHDDGKKMRHIPLIIKMPFQDSPHLLDYPLQNNQLRPIIQSVLDQQCSEEHVLSLFGNPGVQPQGKRRDE